MDLTYAGRTPDGRKEYVVTTTPTQAAPAATTSTTVRPMFLPPSQRPKFHFASPNRNTGKRHQR